MRVVESGGERRVRALLRAMSAKTVRALAAVDISRIAPGGKLGEKLFVHLKRGAWRLHVRLQYHPFCRGWFSLPGDRSDANAFVRMTFDFLRSLPRDQLRHELFFSQTLLNVRPPNESIGGYYLHRDMWALDLICTRRPGVAFSY